MIFGLPQGCRGTLPLALLMAGIWGALAADAPAPEPTGKEPEKPAEKLEFSTSEDLPLLPGTQELDSGDGAGKLDLLDAKQSLGGALGARGRGGSVDPRLLELMQQKVDAEKNWIFVDPDKANRPVSVEEALGVRDASANLSGNRQSGVVAAFLESKGESARRVHTPTRSAGEAGDKSGALDFAPRLGGSLDPVYEIGGAGVGSFGAVGDASRDRARTRTSWDPVLPSSGNAAASPSGATISGLTGLVTEDAQVPNTVRDLIQGPRAKGRDGAATLLDLDRDATRAELNPVLPRRLDFSDTPLLRSSTRGDAAAPVAGLPTPSPYSTASSPLRDLTTKVLGHSSLAPALPPPSTESAPSVKGSTLTIPSRKF